MRLAKFIVVTALCFTVGTGWSAPLDLKGMTLQQTFDDLRRRYRSDTAFRDSVDRYVKEFERLLAKIGQSDRDGSQSRVAMLSDSGKVYVMLAHASGRLG